ncbi:hypothetical protein ACOSQ4_010687 [Xanthoceras sorbifolium]
MLAKQSFSLIFSSSPLSQTLSKSENHLSRVFISPLVPLSPSLLSHFFLCPNPRSPGAAAGPVLASRPAAAGLFSFPFICSSLIQVNFGEPKIV